VVCSDPSKEVGAVTMYVVAHKHPTDCATSKAASAAGPHISAQQSMSNEYDILCPVQQVSTQTTFVI
jgi:hypothetical protein